MAITRRTLAASCAVVALSLGATPALAQEAGAAGATGTDDIVVTARRVSENLQSVPLAVTAFSQDTLHERGISNGYDLAKSVPGLVTNADSGNAALPSFAIRGRGQFFGAASGSVETYFAEVPLSPPFQMPGLPPQFFDLSSAQVLKGPQGTLFGRNTTGGAVLFVPQAPTDKFEGYVRGQLGTYNNRQLEAAVNIPLGEIGGLRLAGFYWKREGYTQTVGGRLDAGASFATGAPVILPSIDVNNQDVIELRGTLLLHLADNIQNTTLVTWHGDKNRGTTQLQAVRGAPPIGADPRIADIGTDLRRPRSDVWAIINTTLWDVTDDIRVKNIASAILAKGYGNNPSDVDGSPRGAIDLMTPLRALKNNQYYEELQLQGKAGPVDYILGGTLDLTRQPGAVNTIDMPTYTFDGAGFDIQFRQSRYTSKALFGSLTFHATDALTLTAAARHTWDDITDNSVQLNNSISRVSTAPTSVTDPVCSQLVVPGRPDQSTQCVFLPGHQNFKGWTWNVGADYKINNDLMVYAGVRHGYKRGGFNGRGGSVALFGPEQVNDFFGGLKTTFELPGGRSHFNIEGFWDEYKGAQRSYLDLANGALVTTIQNVPKARYRGFDADTVLNLTDWFRLSANYTFVDAKYTSFPDLTGGVPQPNNRLAVNVPGLNSRHKVNVQGRFHTDLANGVEVAFIPSMTYQSMFTFNDSSYALPRIGEILFNGGFPLNSVADGANLAPGYTTGDLRLEFNNIGGKFDISFNATNITNKTYVVGGGGIWQFGVNVLSYGPPRMFFAEARYRF